MYELASTSGHVHIMEYLIQQGADVNAINNYGNTAPVFGKNKIEL